MEKTRTESADYFRLFTIVFNENNSLQNSIKNLKEIYSTDDQKVNYENEHIQFFINTNNFLYIVYYCLVLLFAVMLRNNKFSRTMKAFIIISLLLYPFFGSYVEISIFNIIRYVWSFILVRAYPGNALE